MNLLRPYFHWLSVLRIGTALHLLIKYWSLGPDLSLFGGEKTLVDPRLLALAYPGHGWDAAALVWAAGTWLPFVYSLLCLALAAGLFTRLSAALLILLHSGLFTQMSAFSYGADQIGAAILFYCLVFPAGHYESVDNVLFNRRRNTGSGILRKILRLHLCIIYFFGGFVKLLGPDWRNGEALWKAMNLPAYHGALAIDWSHLAQWPLLWTAGGWAIVILELCYPAFIWPAATRRYWLWATIGLHLGISLFMGLHLFAAVMILFNLAAFYDRTYTTRQKQTDPIIPRHPFTPQPAGSRCTSPEPTLQADTNPKKNRLWKK